MLPLHLPCPVCQRSSCLSGSDGPLCVSRPVHDGIHHYDCYGGMSTTAMGSRHAEAQQDAVSICSDVPLFETRRQPHKCTTSVGPGIDLAVANPFWSLWDPGGIHLLSKPVAPTVKHSDRRPRYRSLPWCYCSNRVPLPLWSPIIVTSHSSQH